MATLEAVYNHLVLPPRVPGKQDEDDVAIGNEIMQRMIRVCDNLHDLAGSPWSDGFRALRSSLEICQDINQGKVDRGILMKYFQHLEPDQMIILHLVEQNAALLVRFDSCVGSLDDVIFESFEASPPSAKVLEAASALQWDFPGRAARLPYAQFANENFQEALARFLEQASMEAIHTLQAHARKANVQVVETRDTTDPALITQMLMPLLEAIGSHYDAPISTKRVRDEVNFEDGLQPWRRLPFWLILRVAAKRLLCFKLGDKEGHLAYKVFIASLLGSLLGDSSVELVPEFTIFLRNKLCRRMAKLASGEATVGPDKETPMCGSLFVQVSSSIKDAIKTATARVEATWDDFKSKDAKKIHRLPPRAPRNAQKLALSKSIQYIEEALSSEMIRQQEPRSLDLPKPLDRAIRQAYKFTKFVFELADLETRALQSQHNGSATFEDHKSQCLNLSKQVDELLAYISSLDGPDPELMSSMILAVFCIWVRLDQSANAAYPPLKKYRPVFKPELLDVLQLATRSSMERLQEVQSYLNSRHLEAQYDSILGPPHHDSLAVQYVAQCPTMQALTKRIAAASKTARTAKEDEWERSCAAYDALTMRISTEVCHCIRQENGAKDISNCEKCFHWRTRSRMGIVVHEDYLPTAEPARSTIVFELSIPTYLAAYRHATWRIATLLAYPSRPVGSPSAEVQLSTCSPFRPFMSAPFHKVSLASSVKCFGQTHYKFNSGKIPLENVLVPFGADFQLYDPVQKLWAEDLTEPLTLQHSCGVYVPRGLKSSVFQVPYHPPTIVDGPSSYQIQANQSVCPTDQSPHEFSALQKLLSGKLRRWPNILVELDSANLNLSNEEVMLVLSQLAIQAGPGHCGEPLRAAHLFLRDSTFASRLVDLVSRRLRSIRSNWREHVLMELLIVLSLRLLSLTTGTSRDRAKCLLKDARDITQGWIELIRAEIGNIQSGDTIRRVTEYGFYAALLCRRTFSFLAELQETMEYDDMLAWVRASAALQEHCCADVNQLPQSQTNMLMRDAKMAYQMLDILRKGICAHPGAVRDALLEACHESRDRSDASGQSWTFLQPPDNHWIGASMPQESVSPDCSFTLHFNFLEGHVLFNGQPRGKMPLEIRDSPAFQALFGNQHLMTLASKLPGMSHRLAMLVGKGLKIHFGMRQGEVIVRAHSQDADLEFIPANKFVSQKSDFNDLPNELLDNCVHWLNFRTKCIEIRRRPHIWAKRPRDWILDVRDRIAYRGDRDGSHLVCPYSSLFAQVADIFKAFEHPGRLTVFQPQKQPGVLSVSLRHFELKFEVGKSGLLWSRQHGAEIDHNQDAGTWYGLRSKLVIRDVKSHERSIIVPLGGISYEPQDFHVSVRTPGTNEYGRYKIEDVLGRLSCAPEPRLVYSKALFHAITSFCLPDPLTGKTGTEEALEVLRSGVAQPWKPLKEDALKILRDLKALGPRRAYYPADSSRLQRVTWNPKLTMTVQNDGYEALILRILETSNELEQFVAPRHKLQYVKSTHLQRRGAIRRQAHERPTSGTDGPSTADTVYVSRDRRVTSQSANVFEIVQMVLSGRFCLPKEGNLKSMLERQKLIGGFQGDTDKLFDAIPLVSKIEDSLYEQWGSLVNFCRPTSASNPASVLFRLALLAFKEKADMDMIRILVAFASLGELHRLQPLSHSMFVKFATREAPSVSLLHELIKAPDAATPNSPDPQTLSDEKVKQIAEHLRTCWPLPLRESNINIFGIGPVESGRILESVLPEWDRRLANRDLERYIDMVQPTLELKAGPRNLSKLQPWMRSRQLSTVQSRIGVPSVAQELVVKAGSPLEEVRSPAVSRMTAACVRSHGASQLSGWSHEAAELEKILGDFTEYADPLRAQYGADFTESLTALGQISQGKLLETELNMPSPDHVDDAERDTRQLMKTYFQHILTSFGAGDPRAEWLQVGDLWPLATTTAILELLRSKNSLSFNFRDGMKRSLVNFGLVITRLQWLTRIRGALKRDDKRAVTLELRNRGHDNWEPLEKPDWLLMEIDSNILIRAEQVDVANAIIAPRSGMNSVLQMNMGQGKTSVIVPMVAAVLADGGNLTRLVVPKALLHQTAETTHTRLGGLVGRAIRHIPFSRKTTTSPKMLALYEKLHRDIHRSSGLILTSHEHILSYNLSGWQQLADGQVEAARKMIKFQSWLNEHCRDVLDECDFTLSVKTQLNYPGGPEMPVDGNPHRWRIAQELLGLVAHHIPALQNRFGTSVCVYERQGRFPIVRFEKKEPEDALHELILDDICAGRIALLRWSNGNVPNRQQKVRQFLTKPNFDGVLFSQALEAFLNQQVASISLLVIRGLILNRILLICLDKRWNVQYGLHPKRHPVAVPFDAKGTPSEQSEFGHPDVAILLTCLAFYYTGLSDGQFRQAVQHILKSDDPAQNYASWTSGCDRLPEDLRHWNMINLEDASQMRRLREYLHLDRIVIDHYLNNFVFPAHARQFETKLQLSAWDIPLMSQGDQRAQTTGFSGTNDNRRMLPLSMQQDDLPSLQQTNAEVLTYLLLPRNRAYEVIKYNRSNDPSDRRYCSQEESLLGRLNELGCHVLIDAGAFILEMNNETLAKTWLDINPHAKAAVYFGSDNQAWVKFRTHEKADLPLIGTPFAEDLSDCVVYLDEAHTRGVDLKLPPSAKGALTLALKQTKDSTVQAAMRLRQLKTSQSVTFFAPPEVDRSVRDVCKVGPNHLLDSSHVVMWLLEQTCRTNEELQGLYVSQGLDFCRRTDATLHGGSFLTEPESQAKLLHTLRQPERLTLDQLYGGTPIGSGDCNPSQLSSRRLQGFATKLLGYGNNQVSLQTGIMEEVEQEREVQVQVEQVREVQRPIRYDALSYPGLHPSIKFFVCTGALAGVFRSPSTAGFEHAFACIARTTLGRKHGVRQTGSRLFVSWQFHKTIEISEEQVAYDLLRPVEWLLWSPSSQTALIVIPEEVEHLIPLLRASTRRPLVHLVAYAAPVTKSMLVFNTLRYYSLPELPGEYRFPDWLRLELGVLSGRLYVGSDEWSLLTSYLRSRTNVSHGASDGGLRLDGVAEEEPVGFADDPRWFLLEWLAFRRKAQDVTHTPMGYICLGRHVADDHPFRSSEA
ncbi:hypothetical protein F4780DRAFT_774718 [Xylariomycetidae sp. FL0641]|nr:hypothetical protein F4780DRAFT_774718 [Xylariomycetidae sp. FL0641]